MSRIEPGAGPSGRRSLELEELRCVGLSALMGASPTDGCWLGVELAFDVAQRLGDVEGTLLPVFMPFAPAASVIDRFPASLDDVLTALEVERAFIDHERAEMETHVLAKTNSRSVLGSMNDFIFMAEVDQQQERSADLVALSVRLAHTPCGPLRAGTGFPDLELRPLTDGFAT